MKLLARVAAVVLTGALLAAVAVFSAAALVLAVGMSGGTVQP